MNIEELSKYVKDSTEHMKAWVFLIQCKSNKSTYQSLEEYLLSFWMNSGNYCILGLRLALHEVMIETDIPGIMDIS